ncbi:MAG TPA: molybdenum cofactor biosynthesis protein B [Aestuariivirgaceae bacterium]|jgi:molybdenum cofactor biosynthesis protein B
MSTSDSGKARVFIPVRIAVLTVSNSRTLENDASGDTLQSRIELAGHKLAARTLVKDNISAIRRQVKAWLKSDAMDVIISTGGTGLTGHDVTVEAMRALFEKEIEGFSVAFHVVSFGKIGTSTVQSRATAGVAGGKYIFCLPGSPGACRDGWDLILKDQLDYRHMPCNFVEIMPRLDEHMRRTKG